MKLVDLHVHTTCSDGTFSPEEAVQCAARYGIAAIAITDHDTLEGVEAAMAEGERSGVEVISGVELSAEVHNIERSEMHILGYFVNFRNPVLQDELTLFRNARRKRAEEILRKLADAGAPLDRERILSGQGNKAIGRLHIAKALIEKSYARTINDAFQRYLGIGKPAYVPKLRLTPDEAIKLILRSGGVPVLAHPYYGHYSNKNLLNGLLHSGLKGIEVWHSKHSPSTTDMFLKLTAELGLLPTGGSDCHGPYSDDPPLMGNVKVDYSVLERLKECKAGLDRANTEIF